VERTALLGRLNWQFAEVVEKKVETPQTTSVTLAVPHWPGHLAGQHVDVRLTAEDGYQTERSYSIASPSTMQGQLTLTIERLDDGEVSPYLVDELRVGDKVELRGPIGGYFVWEAQMGGPLLLVAGGSGVVPLMAMIRQRNLVSSTVPTRLLYSVRSYDEIIYRDELASLVSKNTRLEVIYTLTRTQPANWTGYHRRVDTNLLRDVAWVGSEKPLAYICGPTQFVETVAQGLLPLGYEPGRVKTERFGPTGG
jgi:ferredoxin-NADP reductase